MAYLSQALHRTRTDDPFLTMGGRDGREVPILPEGKRNQRLARRVLTYANWARDVRATFARLLCRFGRHTGQKQGGTMMFTCPRCRRMLWQTRDFSAVTAHCDRLIDAGHCADALRVAADAVERSA